mmetsp:Transcript_27846/g.51255  ORF Transcript_27846/g.51255 Transcript_27846/m.51255 type:complete len:385 (-) Transcript_27846:368-1522(-)
MNQPRYSDDNGSDNSWPSNSGNNRRSVAHSTGRSNYGGSRRGKHNQKGNNPIGNWIQNRRQRRRNNARSSSNGGGVAVGTEANAIQNMARNAKHFGYPTEGFITPIEHSLLYAMIEFPEQYPESVVKSVIEEEDFDEYLHVNDTKRKGGATAVSDYGGSDTIGEGGQEEVEEGSDQAAPIGQHATTANQSSAAHSSNEEERVSYAQLSALAALSAEKNPSTATPDANNTSTARASSTNNNPPGSNSANKTNNSSNTNIPPPPSDQPTLTIGQTLVRKLLKTITRYSDTHSLDRQHEIKEFLSPIERRCQIRNEKAALQQLLPAYAGYTLSLVTGNPLPLLIGAAALTQADPMVDENNNVCGFRAVGGRAGDMETAGLLDECESD